MANNTFWHIYIKKNDTSTTIKKQGNVSWRFQYKVGKESPIGMQQFIYIFCIHWCYFLHDNSTVSILSFFDNCYFLSWKNQFYLPILILRIASVFRLCWVLVSQALLTRTLHIFSCLIENSPHVNTHKKACGKLCIGITWCDIRILSMITM